LEREQHTKGQLKSDVLVRKRVDGASSFDEVLVLKINDILLFGLLLPNDEVSDTTDDK
jgi:hypothetical protein